MAAYCVYEEKSSSDQLLTKSTYDQVLGLRKLPIKDFKIKTNATTYTPGDVISGSVLLDTLEDLGCLGIVVCLEGFATINYKSGPTIRKRVEKLLVCSANQWTTTFVIGCVEDYNNFNVNAEKTRYIKIPSGRHIYAFKLSTVKLSPFPGSFKGTSGDVSYRIIACIVIKAVTVRKAILVSSRALDYYFVERPLELHSYLNLESLDEKSQESQAVTIEGASSFLSQKRIKSSLYLSRTGFLPEEPIPFTLYLSNPKGKNISKISVTLLYKISYASDISARINTTNLTSRENKEMSFDSEGKMEWSDCVVIPPDLYPSVSGILIQHQYFIKMEIFRTDDEFPVIVSSVPITIGTVMEDGSMSVANKQLARSMSLMSLASSAGSFNSIPPQYSDIFSCNMSMETLPPLYEDAVGGSETQ